MKTYVINFFFPTQPGGRQEKNVRVDASNLGTALARAWWQVKRDPKYKGRRGLDQACIGVSTVPHVPEVVEAETREVHDP